MTLATHAIAGAALATFVPEHPVVGFCAGFASHLVLDAFPHWNYKVRSQSLNPRVGGKMKLNGDMLIDFFAITAEFLVGIVLVFLFFGGALAPVAIWCGVAGALLPDLLHFIYTRAPRLPLLPQFERFHIKIQREILEKNIPVGVLSQIGWTTTINPAAKVIVAL